MKAAESITHTAIIVEDELHSLERMRTLLKSFPALHIIGIARDGEEAVKEIESKRPDLVFLDIELPVMNGFQVLESLTFRPAVIFVTSYNQYAIKAFEENAVDYILKPTSHQRLEKSIHRVLEGRHLADARLIQLLKQTVYPQYLKRFTVKMEDEILVIPEEDIIFFHADGGYVFLHTVDEKYIYDATLKELEASLDPERFIRISKSAVVAIDNILKFSRWFMGEYTLKMRDKKNTSLKIGKKFLPGLRKKFKF